VHQLPFFVVACDYTLIGEELYAASAYLSGEPRLVGSLKGADLIKIVIITDPDRLRARDHARDRAHRWLETQ
jgi:hypothetical protein